MRRPPSASTRRRQGLKGAFGRVPGAIGRYLSSDLAMGIVSVVVFVLVIKRSSIDPAYPALDLAFSALLIIALLVTAFRFGLFALCWAFFVVNIAGDSNITLLSKPYAGPAWAVAGVLFAMAILGFWLARAGEPLFGRAED